MKKSILLFALVLSACFSGTQAQKKTPVLASFPQGSPPALKLNDPLPANLFVELARVINPAVVNISTKTMPKMRSGPRPQRDPFFDMLEQFYGPQMQQQARPQQALGTGFIIREDGLIVTNNHVIAGADVITVQLTEDSGKMLEAKLIGSDERTDIALIKIESKEKLPVAQLGSSKDLLVGEWVAAFGNPFGNGHTMTKGIISAKGRAIGEINKFPLIQTDAPINPGNSGGPLVNSKGLVVGVNSAIDARAQGIGFAIPIDEVKSIIPQLEANGRIKKGYLGVGLGDIDPSAAAQLGMKDVQGAVILQVDPNTPASRAGIRAYDIVTDFGGKKIENSTELRDAVADAPLGEKIKIRVLREGKNKNLDVVVEERPDLAQKMKTDVKKYDGQKAPMDLGFVVADSNEKMRNDFDLPRDLNRPVILEVAPRSPAARSGLQPGDIILDVNRKEIQNAKDVLKQLRKGTNTLRIKRGDSVAVILLE